MNVVVSYCRVLVYSHCKLHCRLQFHCCMLLPYGNKMQSTLKNVFFFVQFLLIMPFSLRKIMNFLMYKFLERGCRDLIPFSHNSVSEVGHLRWVIWHSSLVLYITHAGAWHYVWWPWAYVQLFSMEAQFMKLLTNSSCADVQKQFRTQQWVLWPWTDCFYVIHKWAGCFHLTIKALMVDWNSSSRAEIWQTDLLEGVLWQCRVQILLPMVVHGDCMAVCFILCTC